MAVCFQEGERSFPRTYVHENIVSVVVRVCIPETASSHAKMPMENGQQATFLLACPSESISYILTGPCFQTFPWYIVRILFVKQCVLDGQPGSTGVIGDYLQLEVRAQSF